MMRHEVKRSDKHLFYKTPLRSLRIQVDQTAHLVASIKWLCVLFIMAVIQTKLYAYNLDIVLYRHIPHVLYKS